MRLWFLNPPKSKMHKSVFVEDAPRPREPAYRPSLAPGQTSARERRGMFTSTARKQHEKEASRVTGAYFDEPYQLQDSEVVKPRYTEDDLERYFASAKKKKPKYSEGEIEHVTRRARGGHPTKRRATFIGEPG